MKHARADYDRIQDPAGLIPDDEPVFLIRGQDLAAPDTLRAYAMNAHVAGAANDIVMATLDQARAMEQWQRERAQDAGPRRRKRDPVTMTGQTIIAGISVPLGDTHFGDHLAQSPLFAGKGTYQFAKIEKALAVSPHRRGVALDVGGHIGLWSRVLAHHFKTVIALEPLPALIPHFRFNTDDCPNVRLYEVAAGAENDDIMIVTVASNSGNGHVAPPGAVADVNVHRTQSVRLDSLNLHNVDLIKIDVEGWELRVVEGAVKTIMRDKPVMVVEQKPNNAERYGVKQRAAVDLLASWGYVVAWEKAGDVCMTHPGAVAA